MISKTEWEQGFLCMEHGRKFCGELQCNAGHTLVNFVFLNNSFDTDVSTSKECSFDEFFEMFNAHNITEEKNSAMFCPWIFIDPSGPRKNENVVGTSMICLDFDDDSGWSIEDAKAVFKKYEYMGYTSFNHQKKGMDRFRIVLPLKDIVTGDQVVERRKAMYEKYAGVDSTSLSRTRAFYIPLCPEERKHLAQVWRNSGKLFDVMEFTPEVYIPSTVEHKPLTDLRREWIFESLKQIFIGHEPAWRNIGLAMCNEGFTLQHWIDVSSHIMNSKSVADSTNKWKKIERDVQKGVPVNAGHLIKVLRNHGHDYKQFLETRKEELNKQLKEKKNG